MPSFDIVSEINPQEIDNAINQTRKEIQQRYDFRGSKSSIELEKEEMKLLSDDNFKMKALIDILQSKVIKRGIDLKALDFGKIEPAYNGLVKCTVKLVAGIEKEKGKELVKKIKDLNLKVQASIQGEQVRVTGKKRDDLQEAIGLLKSADFSIPLQFTNFRD